jgi:hypothetical protein
MTFLTLVMAAGGWGMHLDQVVVDMGLLSTMVGVARAAV